MSKYVTLSAIGAPQADFTSLPKDFSVYEREMKAKLQRSLDDVLPSKPDLIVFPECANRYIPFTRAGLKEYYKYLGDSLVDFLKEVAVNNNTNIAYSAYRYLEDGGEKPFRNSTIYIGRDGSICGIYDKNHLVVEEYTEGDVKYGTEAKTVDLDFGRVASAICFDLNFDELLYKYPSQNPDLIVFCSMFHGGLKRQAQWAYTCRSFLVSAVCGNPCNILNPYGDVIATSTNYTDHVSGRINLDYKLCHWDYNRDKLKAAKAKFKDALTIYDPGYVGSLMLSSEDSDITVDEMIREFEIETLEDYFARVREHRAENIKI
ncbi:MAG: carbon-nitrogen hydrolase family protein [Ruminococcaceae bacterium]|nr:carbon-nitrogen hydrolase family protein [Oscillospiraceae bacterium]